MKRGLEHVGCTKPRPWVVNESKPRTCSSRYRLGAGEPDGASSSFTAILRWWMAIESGPSYFGKRTRRVAQTDRRSSAASRLFTLDWLNWAKPLRLNQLDNKVGNQKSPVNSVFPQRGQPTSAATAAQYKGCWPFQAEILTLFGHHMASHYQFILHPLAASNL